MGNVIISAEGVGKCYRINHQRGGPREGLRHLLNHWATVPYRAISSIGKPQTPSDSPGFVEDFWALQDVSFEIKQGEVLGIIGRNGAGKSTLLKVLSRITEPSRGRVRIKGRVASLLEVGTGFHPELTGRENVYLNGAILGMSRQEIKKKFDEIVAFAEVEKFLDTPVKRYSSGMYVRLAFAVAAHLEPEILIVDEVLAVGDIEFQKKCLGKMESVAHKEGRTILFVSHNIEAVQRLTSQALVLVQGRLCFCGPTQEAIQAYLGESSLADTWTQDVIALPRQLGGTTSARMERVWFSAKKTVFDFGSDISIGLRLRAIENVDDMAFDATIFSANNTAVGTCFSASPVQIKTGEVAEFEFVLKDHGLAPGRYYLDLAALRGSWPGRNSLIDVITGVLHFEIEPPKIEGVPSQWPSGWGEVHFPPAVTRKIS
jgi:lipopolysaccharide transport system ATP-binding protein